MANAKFIVSTDSSADIFKTEMEKKNISCIVMKRILDGKEIAEIYDSVEEFDKFYEELKAGAMPTTTQLNSYELQSYFENLLKSQPTGDIIHMPLSSGLSGSCENAKVAAEKINKNSDRKIYVVDSLLATIGITMLIDRLVELRDEGVEALDAIKKIERIRDKQQSWIIAGDLFHLKRGGRISGFKAMVGTLLGIRPIIVVAKSGRLAIENTIKGDSKAVKYVLDKVYELGVKSCDNFFDKTIYLARTSTSERYDYLKKTLIERFPLAKIKESIVGPIIGTHLGCGCAIVLFEGAERLDI